MLLSGGALALHFCFWVEGIEKHQHHARPLSSHLSPPSSLLGGCGLSATPFLMVGHWIIFSSVTPIIIAGGMWALGHAISNGLLSVHAMWSL